MKKIILTFLLFLSFSVPTFCAIAYVGKSGVTAADAGSSTVASPSRTYTEGNFLVLWVQGYVSGSAPHVDGVSGGTGNTWYNASIKTVAGGSMIELWFCPNCAGGAYTATVTFSSIGTTYRRVEVLEFSGMDTTSGAVDKTCSGTATGSTQTFGTATGTLSQADELCVAAWGEDNTSSWTEGSGYTIPGSAADYTSKDYCPEYKIVSATTSLAPTITFGASVAWLGAGATFKMAGGAASTAVPVFIHHYNLMSMILFNFFDSLKSALLA
jgi:hypothetical protein